MLPAGNYTQLFRWTEETLHKIGELVMHDFPDELNTHLNFMLKAHGEVLITGLGLGCVARGCLENPNVKAITVIERDKDVLKLVLPHCFPNHRERVTIIEDDAIEWAKRNVRLGFADKFDCAWHDIWNDPDKKEPHLAILHTRLLMELGKNIPMQGAWAYPREYRKRFNIL